MREYGTLGRMPREQPPPYQDFLGGNPEDGHQQILIRWAAFYYFMIKKNWENIRFVLRQMWEPFHSLMSFPLDRPKNTNDYWLNTKNWCFVFFYQKSQNNWLAKINQKQRIYSQHICLQDRLIISFLVVTKLKNCNC